MKHTKGPWISSFEARCNKSTLRGPWIEVTSKKKSSHVFLPLDIDITETQANARLIAAAPDLLAACKAALVRFQEDQVEGYHEQHPVTLLEQAIAKAEAD